MNSYPKNKLIKNFDPNGVGQAGKLFGLPFDQETSEIIVIPVPWDVTTSYKDGASLGPEAILKASSQIDLFLHRIPDAWKLGITMLPIDDDWISKNNEARKYAKAYIEQLESNSTLLSDTDSRLILKNINTLSNGINNWVFVTSKDILAANKIPVVVGGDHSSPFGLMKAISASNDEFGVLQIDAHADLRPSYEGFKFSHASIMHNLLTFENVSTLVQVGIRDVCEQEHGIMENDSRIITFYDAFMARERFDGVLWSHQVDEIVDSLPDNIYISLDIDGLEQFYCPSTGTPVPGGMSYNQLIYLFERIMDSGKKILAFDICEVSGTKGEWDAIVGSRLLYNLANVTAVTQKLLHCN